MVDLLKGPSGSLYGVGNTAYSQSGCTAFVARLDTATGSKVWRQTRPGVYLAGAAVDAARNVVLVGSRNGDVVIAKYKPGGSIAWSRTWGGSSTEVANDVAIAPDGSIYVAATKVTSSTKDDAIVLCCGPGGGLRWRHVTATKHDDSANAVTTDGSGNVYVTGSREGTASASKWTTYKLSPGGKRLWRYRVGFTTGLGTTTFGSGVWLSYRGRALYVVAQYGPSGDQLAAHKIAANGEERWLQTDYYDVLSASTLFRSATVDAKGRLYMTGTLLPNSTPGVTNLGVLVVCHTDGTIAWYDEFENQDGFFDTSFEDVAVDTSRRAYCSGSVTGAQGTHAVVVRYEAGGGIETIWSWDGDVAGNDIFGPLLQHTAVYAGGQATMSTGAKAVVHRLMP